MRRRHHKPLARHLLVGAPRCRQLCLLRLGMGRTLLRKPPVGVGRQQIAPLLKIEIPQPVLRERSIRRHRELLGDLRQQVPCPLILAPLQRTLRPLVGSLGLLSVVRRLHRRPSAAHHQHAHRQNDDRHPTHSHRNSPYGSDCNRSCLPFLSTNEATILLITSMSNGLSR